MPDNLVLQANLVLLFVLLLLDVLIFSSCLGLARHLGLGDVCSVVDIRDNVSKVSLGYLRIVRTMGIPQVVNPWSLAYIMQLLGLCHPPPWLENQCGSQKTLGEEKVLFEPVLQKNLWLKVKASCLWP